MKKIMFGITVLIVWITVSCSSTKNKNEMNKSVKDFIAVFKEKINGPDTAIFKMFASDQEGDQILRVIEILRNKDKTVNVNVLFDEANQYVEDYYVLVDVPIDLTGGNQPSDRTFFSLRLVPQKGSFLIIAMEVDRLFPAFFSLKSTIENSDMLSKIKSDLKPYYDRAKELQKNYDTVVWFVNHDTSTYYYVINGKYNFDNLKGGTLENYKMGLVDKTGKVVVPVEYDLIGNPSMILSNAVEVSKGGKIGYYSLDGKGIVPVDYDWLVPYTEGTTIALVFKDSVYGWLDNEYRFHENFPSRAAEESIKEFNYLTGNTFTFKGEEQGLINVLHPLNDEAYYHGNGLFLPSAYLVKLGIFPRFNDNFITKRTENFYQFGNDLLEAKSQKPFSISDALSGFITAVEKRFIGGRGEFYTEQKISFVDREKNIVSSISIFSGKELSFKRVNDSLYQYTHLANLDYEMGPGDNFPEQNFPHYGYFQYDGKKMKQLSSYRRFAFTQFMKMDSSFLTGNFDTWDSQTRQSVKSNFVSIETIGQMRNEILAGYGFIFKNLQEAEQFKYANWYKPSIESYDEVYSKASEIDKYNLDFLNKLIGSTPDGKSI